MAKLKQNDISDPAFQSSLNFYQVFKFNLRWDTSFAETLPSFAVLDDVCLFLIVYFCLFNLRQKRFGLL